MEEQKGSIAGQAEALQKLMAMQMEQSVLRSQYRPKYHHPDHNEEGKTVEMKDGTIYEVQYNGSWKKVREGLKGKARRKLEKAMAEVNV